MFTTRLALICFIAWATFSFPLGANSLQSAFNSMQERLDKERRNSNSSGTFLASENEREIKDLLSPCMACHNFNKGEPSRGLSKELEYVGPNLFGVFGRKIGAVKDFRYSPAFLRLGTKVWTEEELNRFLRMPEAYAPGTSMKFSGLLDPQDRQKIINYLKSLK
jgi:cytochrome c